MQGAKKQVCRDRTQSHLELLLQENVKWILWSVISFVQSGFCNEFRVLLSVRPPFKMDHQLAYDERLVGVDLSHFFFAFR